METLWRVLSVWCGDGHSCMASPCMHTKILRSYIYLGGTAWARSEKVERRTDKVEVEVEVEVTSVRTNHPGRDACQKIGIWHFCHFLSKKVKSSPDAVPKSLQKAIVPTASSTIVYCGNIICIGTSRFKISIRVSICSRKRSWSFSHPKQ
jgi:hypothetical protein